MNSLLKLISSGCVALGFALASNASALTLTSANVLGTVNPGTPSGDDFSGELVRFLVVKHNIPTPAGTTLGDNPADSGTEAYILRNQFGSALPLPITLNYKNDNSNTTISGLGTYEYVLGKYGNDAVVFYIGNLVQDGSITLPNKVNTWFSEIKGGLSHTSFFNERTSVPDGGATALLLGLGFLGLAVGVRKKS